MLVSRRRKTGEECGWQSTLQHITDHMARPVITPDLSNNVLHILTKSLVYQRQTGEICCLEPGLVVRIR